MQRDAAHLQPVWPSSALSMQPGSSRQARVCVHQQFVLVAACMLYVCCCCYAVMLLLLCCMLYVLVAARLLHTACVLACALRARCPPPHRMNVPCTLWLRSSLHTTTVLFSLVSSMTARWKCSVRPSGAGRAGQRTRVPAMRRHTACTLPARQAQSTIMSSRAGGTVGRVCGGAAVGPEPHHTRARALPW